MDKARTELYDQGYTIIPNIMTTEEHQAVIDSFISDLTAVNSALDVSTVADLMALHPNVDYPCSNTRNNTGIIASNGLPQGEAAWLVRSNNQIMECFKELLDTEEIVCSMDIISFSSDHVDADDGRCPLHVDQTPGGPGHEFLSLQGIYYATATISGGATTMVVPGSHKQWSQLNLETKRSFSRIHNQLHGEAIQLVIPENSLLIFNSKLIHRGYSGPHRLCFMVSYGRKKDRPVAARMNKMCIYNRGKNTTHWSQLGIESGCGTGADSTTSCWNTIRPSPLADHPERDDLL